MDYCTVFFTYDPEEESFLARRLDSYDWEPVGVGKTIPDAEENLFEAEALAVYDREDAYFYP